jgi:hypothetical protein
LIAFEFIFFDLISEWHMAVGMGLVLQVGESDDMVKPPKNFPKCNNFKPDVDFSLLNLHGVEVSLSSKPIKNLTSETSDVKVDIKSKSQD